MGKCIDLTGQTFHRLEVIKRVDNDKFGRAQFICICRSDSHEPKEVVVSGQLLTSGKTKSCGCIKTGKQRDYRAHIGEIHNRLKILEYGWKPAKNPNRKIKTQPWFICECECGNSIDVLASNVLNGHTKSCGCYEKDCARERGRAQLTTHGESKTRLYGIWIDIRRRCYDENNHNYYKYGLKGISMCDEWRDNFEAFRDWCIEHGYREDIDEKGRNRISIDRIKNTKGYAPDNCRFTTRIIQARNKGISKNNNTGVKGVSYRPEHKNNKWVAQIGVNGKHISLGSYPTKEAAAEARAAGEKRYWGEAI